MNDAISSHGLMFAVVTLLCNGYFIDTFMLLCQGHFTDTFMLLYLGYFTDTYMNHLFLIVTILSQLFSFSNFLEAVQFMRLQFFISSVLIFITGGILLMHSHFPQFSRHETGVTHVLVTGGAGYIGSHATLRLLSDKYRVTIVVISYSYLSFYSSLTESNGNSNFYYSILILFLTNRV
jgi:hypothetical protein